MTDEERTNGAGQLSAERYDLAETIGGLAGDLQAELESPGHQGHDDLTSVREVEYEGHAISIRTSYEITVDGQPFRGHATVDRNGEVHTHATPQLSYGSAVGMMQRLIDLYPESFSAPGEGAGRGNGHGG